MYFQNFDRERYALYIRIGLSPTGIIELFCKDNTFTIYFYFSVNLNNMCMYLYKIKRVFRQQMKKKTQPFEEPRSYERPLSTSIWKDYLLISHVNIDSEIFY